MDSPSLEDQLLRDIEKEFLIGYSSDYISDEELLRLIILYQESTLEDFESDIQSLNIEQLDSLDRALTLAEMEIIIKKNKEDNVIERSALYQLQKILYNIGVAILSALLKNKLK